MRCFLKTWSPEAISTIILDFDGIALATDQRSGWVNSAALGVGDGVLEIKFSGVLNEHMKGFYKGDYPEFVDRLEEHELIYTRVLGEGDDPLSPIGRGWGWKAWNDTRVDRRWCKNSYGATAWWQLILVEKMQANDPEKAVTFGDGTPLPAHVIHDCLKILEEESVVIPWQKGADLLLDNLSVLHARRAFKPPHRVLASLCK
ncbi:clavaminate synthase-like protein [Tanacetum coccineum]